MMQFMRDRMGQTFLVVVVGLIALVFVFSGVFGDRFGGGTGATDVANVGGERITTEQLQNAVNREVENYRSLGMELPPEMIANVRRSTLNGLVQAKLMLVEARRLGIQASDKEVADEIHQIPLFQDPATKTFNVDLYRKALAERGLKPAQVEEDIRQSMTQQRMQKFLADRIRVTPAEVEREFKLANDTRNIAFVRFSREDALKKMQIDAKEIDSFLADKSKEAQINGYYAQNNMKYNQPEKVCARHILKRAAQGAAAEEKTAPKDFLALKPTAGNFAELAKKHSEDPGSKAQGGDLECFPRGAMDKAFEDAAFSLPVGKVSEPVKSQFGWHYILVTKKEPAVNKPIESVRREIAEAILKSERVEDIRKTNMASAEAVAKNWASASGKQETGPFNSIESAIPKIGRAEEILKAAFDPAAKIQSGPQIFESQGGVIVAQVKEKKQPDMSKFAEDKDKQAKTLKERKLRAFLPAWLEDVQKRTKMSFNQDAIQRAM
jgi:peptidyl-prolyl cis-trans isomerase D